MRDSGQHLHAVVVEAAQALLHPIEGIDRTCNSRGPFGGNNGASPLAPSCSTAPASSDSGFVSLLAARMESRIIRTAVKPSHAPKAACENWVAARRGSGGDSKLVVNSSQ